MRYRTVSETSGSFPRHGAVYETWCSLRDIVRFTRNGAVYEKSCSFWDIVQFTSQLYPMFRSGGMRVFVFFKCRICIIVLRQKTCILWLTSPAMLVSDYSRPSTLLKALSSTWNIVSTFILLQIVYRCSRQYIASNCLTFIQPVCFIWLLFLFLNPLIFVWNSGSGVVLSIMDVVMSTIDMVISTTSVVISTIGVVEDKAAVLIVSGPQLAHHRSYGMPCKTYRRRSRCISWINGNHWPDSRSWESRS